MLFRRCPLWAPTPHRKIRDCETPLLPKWRRSRRTSVETVTSASPIRPAPMWNTDRSIPRPTHNFRLVATPSCRRND